MWDLTDVVLLSVEIKDEDGERADVGFMEIAIIQPDLTSASILESIDNVATGIYEYHFTPTQPGRHEVYWTATGSNASGFTDTFDVDAGASGIVSLADARQHLNFLGLDTSNDEELRTFVDAASEVMESYVGPVVRRTVVATVYPAGGLLFLDAPLVSVTSVVAAHGYVGDYDVADLNVSESGIVRYNLGQAWTPYPVTVTYVAGRAVVPARIRLAALDLLRLNWRPQQGGGRSAFDGDEESGEVRLGFFVPRDMVNMLVGELRAPVVA